MNKRSVIWSLFQKHSLIWWPTLPFKNFSSLRSMCMKFSDLKFWVQTNTFATEKSLKYCSVYEFRPVVCGCMRLYNARRMRDQNSQDFTTPQISFKFSGFDYTSNSFLIKPLHTNDRKTHPFREILSQRKGRGEDRVDDLRPVFCGTLST